MATGIEEALLTLLFVIGIGAFVGVATARLRNVPATITLLVIGLLLSALNVEQVLGISLAVSLSKDLILIVLIPPLLFKGAADVDYEILRQNLTPIMLLAIPGLILSIAALAVLGVVFLGFSPLVSLLFAIIIAPTDPVSVLAVFEDVGVSERLSVVVEGESLVNDGVAVVLFTVVVGLLQEGATVESLATLSNAGSLVAGIIATAGGGAIVGGAVGYLIFQLMSVVDQTRLELALTLIATYGSFLMAEHYLGVSGVIATVAAGLLIGNQQTRGAMSSQTRLTVEGSLSSLAYGINTIVFVAIGVTTPLNELLSNAGLIAVAIPIVLAARALAVYPVAALTNRVTDVPLNASSQHLIWWGGLHATIPIALALGVPPQGGEATIRPLVYGVAAFSLLVQGLSIPSLIKHLDIPTADKEQRLYETMLTRSRMVNNALETAERLYKQDDIDQKTYEQLANAYKTEKEKLNNAIGTLLEEKPVLREEQRLRNQRKVIAAERNSVQRALRGGEVSKTVGKSLLDEVNVKLQQVDSGATMTGEENPFTGYWEQQARALGVLTEEDEDVAEDNEDDSNNDDATAQDE